MTSPEEIANSDPDYELPKEMCRENVNQSVGSLLFSPMKPVSNQYKVAYEKRKLDQVLNSTSQLIASALDLSVDELTGCALSKMTQECRQKACNLNMLTEAIKERLKIANNNENVKLPNITPISWSIQQTGNIFCVSTAMVKKARNVKTANGILSEPKEKTGKPISDELKQAAEHFFESDQYSRMCPEKKEFVSVKIDGVKQHKQKKLPLCNSKELQTKFLKSTHLQIGFSKFCQLRPKWCITVTSGSGIHFASACEIHQNVKLLTTVLLCD